MSDVPNFDDREATFARLRSETAGELSSSEPRGSDASPAPSALGGVIIPLSFPPSASVTSVTVLPPLYGDVEAVTEGQMSEIEMYANMCGLPGETFRALRWTDAEKIIVAARHLAPEIKRF